jgi:Uma2 family endonuclease
MLRPQVTAEDVIDASTLPRPEQLHAARAAFLAMPEPAGEPAYEFEADGSITQKMAPRPRHSRIQRELLIRFEPAHAQRIAEAYPELRIVWPTTVAVTMPDVSVYRWERRPIGPDGQLLDEATLPPDIAIEIISPDQSITSQGAKCALHVERGAGVALLLDPERQTAHLYTPADPLIPRALAPEERLELAGLLPDPPTVAELFAALTPEP